VRAERALARAAAACALAVAALAGAAPPAAPPGYEARAVHVRDGDSLIVNDGVRQREVRIAEIDAPEQGQAWADEAERALAKLVEGRALRVEFIELDRFGREVSRLWVGGRCVACELVRAGHAWAFRKYLRDPELLVLERSARDARRGLWSLPDETRVPPSAWRRGLRSFPPDRLERLFEDEAGAAPASSFRCRANPRCGELTSCAEARFQLERCDARQLDRDGDGVPCDQRCR
jgi:endonuclease YncB( thermonuclease family)